jgi:pimeloyl-ACP methyl ester carboxylesterase
MPFTEEKVSVRNGMFNVTVKRGGSGEPLVYLHAAGGQPEWETFLDLLSQRFEVIVPIHPGWPGSEGLDHLDDVVDMGLYYLDLFDTLGLKDINLVGAALGGRCAAEVAALGPQYVKKLVLASPAGLWLDDHQPLDFFTATPDTVAKAMWYDPEAAAARAPKIDPENREAVAKATLDRQMSLSSTSKFVWPIWDKGLKKRIHRIKAPTLLVWGEKDGLNPPVYGSEFQRLIPGSELEILPKAAHAAASERPEDFARVVTAFLMA